MLLQICGHSRNGSVALKHRRLQVKNYLTEPEAALMLYTSLSGEAETESEHLELSRINSKGGIPYIVDNLRAFGKIPRHGINLLSDQHGLVLVKVTTMYSRWPFLSELKLRSI